MQTTLEVSPCRHERIRPPLVVGEAHASAAAGGKPPIDRVGTRRLCVEVDIVALLVAMSLRLTVAVRYYKQSSNQPFSVAAAAALAVLPLSAAPEQCVCPARFRRRCRHFCDTPTHLRYIIAPGPSAIMILPSTCYYSYMENLLITAA